MILADETEEPITDGYLRGLQLLESGQETTIGRVSPVKGAQIPSWTTADPRKWPGHHPIEHYERYAG